MWLDGDLGAPLPGPRQPAEQRRDATRDAEGEIRLQAQREGGYVAISVRDNGIGIAPETLARIFEMFNRGDAARRAWESGLGIGLTLARRIAELHGGSIDAHSEGPARGSEFVVRLPLAQRAAPDAAPAVDGERFAASWRPVSSSWTTTRTRPTAWP